MHPNSLYYLFSSWYEIDQIGLKKYVSDIIQNDKSKIIDLVKAFTPTVTSTIFPEPHKSNMQKDNFDYLDSILDTKYIYDTIIENYKDEIEKENVRFLTHHDNDQTDINILRQFVHFYNQKHQKN